MQSTTLPNRQTSLSVLSRVSLALFRVILKEGPHSPLRMEGEGLGPRPKKKTKRDKHCQVEITHILQFQCCHPSGLNTEWVHCPRQAKNIHKKDHKKSIGGMGTKPDHEPRTSGRSQITGPIPQEQLESHVHNFKIQKKTHNKPFDGFTVGRLL